MGCPDVPYRHSPPRYRRVPVGLAVERSLSSFRGRLMEIKCEDNPSICCGERPHQGPPVSIVCPGGVPRLLTAQFVFYQPPMAYPTIAKWVPFPWADLTSSSMLVALERMRISLSWSDAASLWSGTGSFVHGNCYGTVKMEVQYIHDRPGIFNGVYTTPAEPYPGLLAPLKSLGQLFVDNWSTEASGAYYINWRHDLNGSEDCWPPMIPPADAGILGCGYNAQYGGIGYVQLQNQISNFSGTIAFDELASSSSNHYWGNCPLMMVSCDPFYIEYGFGEFHSVIYNQYGEAIGRDYAPNYWTTDPHLQSHHAALDPEAQTLLASLIITEALP